MRLDPLDFRDEAFMKDNVRRENEAVAEVVFRLDDPTDATRR